MQTATVTAVTATVRRFVRCGLVGLVAALLLAALALASPVATVRAATRTVTNCNDSGAGSLRDAIANATAGDTIAFAQNCNGTTAPNTTITLLSTLMISKNVTIDATVGGHAVTVSGNNAVGLFVVNVGVTLGLAGLTLTGGNTGGNGGAINNNGTLTITGSTFSGNTGGNGGAIFNQNILNITNSTFASNTTGGFGGAIFNGRTLTVTGSTFSGNTASGNGGAIFNAGAMLTLTLSVVAGNTGGAGPDINGNVTTDGGGNVIGDTTGTGNFTGPNDKLNVNPLLGTLASNGGTVQTRALLTGSPAIDILACPIDPISGTTLAIDARGVSRPQGAGNLCDAGAFEARAFAVSALTGNGQSANINTAFGNPVGLTLTGTGTDPVAGGQVTFTITPSGGGASATFGMSASCTVTGGTVAVCTIPAGGMTNSPPFTANGTAGAFTIVVTANGVPMIPFIETNTPTPMTYTVNRTADDKTDAACNSVANGGCTLREAVNASNANDPGAGANTITFDPTVFNTAQTITLTVEFGPLRPTRSVTIAGPGANLLTVDAGCTTCAPGGAITNGTKHFLITGAGTYAISGLTLQHGRGDAAGSGSGGAVDVNTGSAPTVTLTGMVFRENATTNSGGAVYAGGGGALMLAVAGSTFSGNSAGNGGALAMNPGATATVTNSTFTGNSAAQGGAILLSNATVAVTGSTLSGNSARARGGGIFASGTLTLTLSIVAGNTSGGSPDLYGTVNTDGGGNVIGDTTGATGLTAASDKLNVPALLAPLAVVAPGAVPTVGLLPGSPAIDILACPIDPISGTTLATDARGVPRPQGASNRCDAGAFESRGFTVSATTGNGQSALVNTAFANPVGLTVTSADSIPVAGGQITFTITPGGGGASATFGTSATCTVTGGAVAVCTIPTGSSVATSPPFTANTVPGAFTILATANGVPTTTFTETNIPGPAVRFTVASCPASVLSGTPCTVTVTAQDQFGNTATGYAGTVAITSSDPQAVLPPNTTLMSGVGMFTVTLRTPGMQRITATDTVTSTITGTQTGITVTGTAPAAVNDSYPVTTGTTLTVPAAQGVLANDTRGNPQATISANTQPAHGSVMLNTTDGSFTYTPTAGYTGADSFTYTLTNAVSSSTGTVNLTVIAATVTSLTTTAPPANGGMTPTLLLGGKLTLTTTATYNNGTTGAVSPLLYTSSNPGVASVDPVTGVVTANTAGQVTITVTGPNGSRTTITVTVTGAAGTGLMPNPQPLAHPGATAATVTPLPQPGRHP